MSLEDFRWLRFSFGIEYVLACRTSINFFWWHIQFFYSCAWMTSGSRELYFMYVMCLSGVFQKLKSYVSCMSCARVEHFSNSEPTRFKLVMCERGAFQIVESFISYMSCASVEYMNNCHQKKFFKCHG